MATTTNRYIDSQGRIIIPNHIRKALNLQPGNNVMVSLADDGTIRIRANTERCSVCGNDIDAGESTINMSRKGAKICMFCAHTIAEKVKED